MGCELCKPPPNGDDPMVKVKLFSTATFIEETVGFLSKVKLFQRFPEDQIPVLATGCKQKSFNKDSVIIKQGEYGTEFFVIVTGTVSVNIDGKKVTTFGSGDYFGEVALLRDEPRTATIIAEEAVMTLTISREKFKQMGLNEKLDFQKRYAVIGCVDRKIETRPPSHKTDIDHQKIVQALKSNANLAKMVILDDSKIQQVCDVTWEQTINPGERIIKQGSDGDYFYIVKEGAFDVFVKTEVRGAGDAVQEQVERVGEVSEGGSFGELALFYFAPRRATVQAKVTSVVWVIDRDNFKKILVQSADEAARINVTYLEKKDVFKQLKPEEKYEVAKALVECDFLAGECVFEQGEKGTSFYILCQGEVAVIKDNKELVRLKGEPDKVEIFGELALISGESRSATIKAVTDVRTLSMDKTSFDFLLGDKVGKKYSSEATGKEKIHRKDLHPIGPLGCGGFGAVMLVEHTTTKRTYALKALSKGHIIKSGMQRFVMSEKTIQYMCDCDFIIRLYETYTSQQSLYFLLELALGGELHAVYMKKGFHGKVTHARFYIAGTGLAFVHMHSLKVIYRDLKPENLLLTETGEVKLTDMGFAKIVVGKTYTTCGTPDYFAPEMISSVGHTEALDWWTLGILIFELMTGHPPFASPAPMQICRKIREGIDRVEFPAQAKGPCEKLVKALCNCEPSLRLPMKRGGFENICKHAWYSDFSWEAMRNHTMERPFEPTLKSRKDFSNFSVRKEDLPPQVKYEDDGSDWDKDFATST